jgi:hypothetical protein
MSSKRHGAQVQTTTLLVAFLQEQGYALFSSKHVGEKRGSTPVLQGYKVRQLVVCLGYCLQENREHKIMNP